MGIGVCFGPAAVEGPVQQGAHIGIVQVVGQVELCLQEVFAGELPVEIVL